jgi:hypothetical protein
LIESGSFALSIWVNALRGTALDGAELVVAFVVVLAAEALLLAPTPDVIAFERGLSTVEDGV